MFAIDDKFTQLRKFHCVLLPPLTPLTEHRLKMTLKERASVLEVSFGVGSGGGETRKRFVEQGDDSLLFGEWWQDEIEITYLVGH